MIVLICGPPAVGKTTVATLLEERLREQGRSIEVLDSDQYSRKPYERMYGRVEDSSKDWIIAATFYKRRWQSQFHALEDVVIVYLTADLETCLERNRQRDDQVEEEAVHIIWREFDEPDADVIIDTEDRSPESVVDTILAEVDLHSGGNGASF